MTGARRLLDSERGSLPLAMLLTVVGIGLSGLLAANVSAQILAARYSVQQSDAFDAAQAGAEVVVGMIRVAVTTGAGDVTKLPCGPFTGTVNTATDQTWSATVFYLTGEPPKGDLGYATANRLGCPAAATYGSATPKPQYALISVTGRALDGTRGRILNTVYPLRTTSRDNFAGGQIHAYNTGTPGLCFTAPSAVPPSGSALTLKTCDLGSDTQQFAWTTAMTLVLVSSRAGGSTGMCLDAAAVQNEPVVFKPCQATPVARQQWALTSLYSWEGSDGTNLNRFCFRTVNPGVSGSGVVLNAVANDAAACDGGFSNTRTFTVDQGVGTGRNGVASNQLLNYEQYNRCVEVPGADPASLFLTLAPCLQKPPGVAVDWRQTWTLPAVTAPATSASGRVWTKNTADNKEYCLTSPGNTTGYVKLTQCPGTLPASMIWTRFTSTGVYNTSYLLRSTFGAPSGTFYCLNMTTIDLYNGSPKIELDTCVTSIAAPANKDQKWNVPPLFGESAELDLNED